MKKRFIIIFISVLVLTGIVVAFFLLNTNKEDEPTAENVESFQFVPYIKAVSCEQLREMTAEQGIALLLADGDVLAINGVSANGKKMDITFQYNGDAIEMIRWSYEICAAKDVDVNDEQALDDLKYDIFNITSFLGVILEENIDTFQLYATEGYPIDASELSTYGQLLTGEVVFDLTVKDRDGTIWNARTNLSEDGILSVHFYRSLQKEFNDKITADITLE